MMSERSSHKQMAINMASSVVVFSLGLCVSFFLTPFIVDKLGIAAYGFIGLSNQIIGYSGLLTVAVNSMAGRFITIKFHEGDYKGANIYMSSIFYTNLSLSGILMVVFGVIAYFLPYLIDIPNHLVTDVQTLFILLCLSTCLGLIMGVIGVSCFIKNRLDLSNIRTMVGKAIDVTLLLILFGFFAPRLWYIGITSLAMMTYGIVTNYILFKRLTPQLHISFKFFDWGKLKEVISSGAWNIISRLSELLSRGFDLLFANLFVSATAMGMLSISQTIPFLLLGFFSTISANFSPDLTKLYAQHNIEGLKNKVIESVRLCGFISCVPLVCVYAFADVFYSLWLPQENSQMLYYLTLVAMIAMLISLPLEPLWNIFTITNKVRHSSMNLLYNSLLSFGTIVLAMLFVDNDMVRLFVLASSRSIFGVWRNATFLPIFGAKCLLLPRGTFYPIMLKTVLNVILIVPIAFALKRFIFLVPSWSGFIAECSITLIVGLTIAWFTILRDNDRTFVLSYIKAKFQ